MNHDDVFDKSKLEENKLNISENKNKVKKIIKNSDNEIKEKIDPKKLNLFLNIPVEITLELGRTKISINELIKLNENTIIPLDKKSNEPLNIMVNGHLIAYGEIVTMGEQYGIRITEIANLSEKILNLKE